MPERVLQVKSADGTILFEQHIPAEDAVFLTSEPLQVIEANPRNRIERQEIGEAVVCQIGGQPPAVDVTPPPEPEAAPAPAAKPKRAARAKSVVKKASAKKPATKKSKKSSSKAKK